MLDVKNPPDPVGFGLHETVGAPAEAVRFRTGLSDGRVVDANSFKVTAVPGRRAISISRGTASLCGVMVENTTPIEKDIDANNDGITRMDYVWIHVDQDRASAEIMVSPVHIALNRPELGWDLVLAVVRVPPRATTIVQSNINLVATWGGGGSCTIGGNPEVGVRKPEGSIVYGERGQVWRLDSKRVPRPLFDSAAEFVEYTPYMYSDTGAISLGNGGKMRGRYSIVNDLCVGQFEVRPNPASADLGIGPLTVDMPVVPDRRSMPDFLWVPAHACYVVDGQIIDFAAQLQIPAGNRRALVWTPVGVKQHLQAPAAAAKGGGDPGTGCPQFPGRFSVPSSITAQFEYPIDRR